MSNPLNENSERKIYVNSEIGRLLRVMVHRPDRGIGMVHPRKAQEWLYEDIVYFKKMKEEYDLYLTLLIFFLDGVDEGKKAADYFFKNIGNRELGKNYAPKPYNHANADKYFHPTKGSYFRTSKNILDPHRLLADILTNESIKHQLVGAVCAIENCSYKTQSELLNITLLDGKEYSEDEKKIKKADTLATTLITGRKKKTTINKKTGEHKREYIFPPIPNFIFTRDIGITVEDSILLSRTAYNARKRESILIKYIALHHPELFEGKSLQERKDLVIEISEDENFSLMDKKEQKRRKVTLEGGDIMMIAPNHLLIGMSQRTTPSAVNRIIQQIFLVDEKLDKVSVVKIPKDRSSMHLDTVVTQVDKDTWVIFGPYGQEEKANDDESTPLFRYTPSLLGKSDKKKVKILRYDRENGKKKKGYRLKVKGDSLEKLCEDISHDDLGLSREEKVRFIYCADGESTYEDREQWSDACNVLAVQPGVVIGYDRNEQTAMAFKEKGYAIIHVKDLIRYFLEEKISAPVEPLPSNLFQEKDVTTDEQNAITKAFIENFERYFKDKIISPQNLTKTLILLPSAELSRARGGSHCMSFPLEREKWPTLNKA